jgi:hypothetical protein
MAYSKWENRLKYTIVIGLFWYFSSRMNKLVYMYVHKLICDRSSSFEIIHQKVCRSYGEHDSSICELNQITH